jgi:hypothetical protein
VTQVARNLTDADDGFLRGTEYLILDRDPLYTAAFRHLLRDNGVKPLLLPARSPNLNAFAGAICRVRQVRVLGPNRATRRETAPSGRGPSVRESLSRRNDRTRAWATSSSRRRPHHSDRAQYGAVRGSAACSSSITTRPRNPSAEFSHTTGCGRRPRLSS